MSELYVLDFDRTLADTDNMFDKLCDAAGQIDPDLKQELINYNENRFSQGNERSMFHPGNVLGDKKTEVFQTFIDNISKEEKEYIYEDAKRFLDKINKLSKSAIILTFGDSEWQKAKVDATLGDDELDIPVIYTEEKIKSKIIDSWHNNNFYKIGPHEATQIVGVGDEISDFIDYENLPNSKGYLIDPHNKKEVDMLPDNVKKIKSLDEVTLSE